VGVPATTSVLNSVGVLESFGRGARMLSTTESSSALAFDALSWGEARGGDPCCVHTLELWWTTDWTYLRRYPAH